MLSIRRSSSDRSPTPLWIVPSIRSRSSQGQSLSNGVRTLGVAEMMCDWRQPTDSASVSRNGTCEDLRGYSQVSCLRVIWRSSSLRGKELFHGLKRLPWLACPEWLSKRDADLEIFPDPNQRLDNIILPYNLSETDRQ
jgi:hypothetical protein